MSQKYFGTDGIRGKVGVFPMTPDFVMKFSSLQVSPESQMMQLSILLLTGLKLENFMEVLVVLESCSQNWTSPAKDLCDFNNFIMVKN